MGKAMSSDPNRPTGARRDPDRRSASTALFYHREDPPRRGEPAARLVRVVRRPPLRLSPSLLFSWKRRMLEGGHQAVHADEEVVGTSRVVRLERRVRDLRTSARAQDHGGRDPEGGARPRPHKKTDLAAQLLGRFDGRFAVKAVADTLGVARSHLAERLSRPAQPRGPYRKHEDAQLLPTIRAIVDAARATAIAASTALVNRALSTGAEVGSPSLRVVGLGGPGPGVPPADSDQDDGRPSPPMPSAMLTFIPPSLRVVAVTAKPEHVMVLAVPRSTDRAVPPAVTGRTASTAPTSGTSPTCPARVAPSACACGCAACAAATPPAPAGPSARPAGRRGAARTTLAAPS